VQKAIGRLQPFETVKEATVMLREVGIAKINFDLMYGLPGQTISDVQETVRQAHTLSPSRLAVFGYAHVPWMKSHQRMIDTAALPGLEARQAQAAAAHAALTQLGYRAIGLDHYAHADDELAAAAGHRRLRRNFQGYTTDPADALIGFGASAIGRLPQGYVQNAPDLGGYARAIAAGQLATVRGVALSPDDRSRARVIEQLMCDLSIDLDATDDKTGIAIHEYFAEELRRLDLFRRAGLIDLDKRRITVTEAGRPYLRVLAATFDAYLPGDRGRHSLAV
jgi:oxygen-independent coproporphyrinogen III oxidase